MRPSKRTNTRRKLTAIIVTAAVVAAAAAAVGPAKPASAGLAQWWQLACWPYGPANYDFGQYVGGWGYHVAQDVCHEAGIPVYAAADGTVVYSAQTEPSARWGNLIIIEHLNPDGNRAISLYGHLNSDRRVGAGQSVTKGERIGTVGPRGNVNGNWSPHVHFGIRPGPYRAGIGQYDSSVHGYEPSCCGGWTHPSNYTGARTPPYDHVPFDVLGGGDVYYNNYPETRVTFRLRNTGNYTWQKDGNTSTPVRLGTAVPQNRGSGFSDNGNAPGWAGATRIKLDNDTPPGGLATFTATFRSNRVPGSYRECFSPIVENVGWMTERLICVNVNALAPGYRSEWHTQMITTNSDPNNLTGQTSGMYMLPGQKLNLKLMVKNVGELDWQAGGGNPTRLASTRPRDRASAFATGGDSSIPLSENWPRYDRPSNIDGRYDPGTNTVVADSTISNGEIAVFSFTATAPQQAGTYHEYFNPVVEGITHLPDLGMHFTLRVLDQGYHYEWVTQSINPTSVGQTTTTQDATLQIKNTGRESWPVGGDVKLGTWSPRDYDSWLYTASGTGAWLSPSRLSPIDRNVTKNNTDPVAPGEVAEFSMRFTVPTTIPQNNYRFYVRPVKEGVVWFPEDYGIFFPVNITVPPYRHQVTHQAFTGTPGNFQRHSTMTARLGVRNTGRAAWPADGPNPLRLGTARPNDRASGFADLTAADPWLSLSRASGIDGRLTSTSPWTVTPDTSIGPDEVAAFEVPLKANAAPGTYHEYFNLVLEGITWFPDIGIFWPLTVVNGSGSGSQPTTPGSCEVSAATLTVTGCSTAKADTGGTADPVPLWREISCQSTDRHRQVLTDGDLHPTATGTSQTDFAYRQLTVNDGDDYFGERCELGRNDWRDTFQTYREGERAITAFSIRLPDSLPLATNEWQDVMQMKQAQPSDGGGGVPILFLGARQNQWQLDSSTAIHWTTPATRNVWTRFVFDVTYSRDPGKGRVVVYVDLNEDGDALDPGEQSPVLTMATLKTETAGTSADGLAAGDSIPSHLRLGIYHHPAIACAEGCSVEIDNVQVLRPES